MGVVRIEAEIGASNDSLKKVEFMVDTGAFYTMLPPAICDELGLVLNLRERVVTADNRRLTIELGAELGAAHMKIDGHEGGILVGKMSVPWLFLASAPWNRSG